MLERVLVPLDGSRAAEAVLDQAAPMLAKADSDVVLLRVVEFGATETGMALEYLDDVRRRLASRGVRARRAVRESPAAPAILDAAAQERATMIAMATHGRTGAARFVFGSVAEKVLRASTVPVFVARAFDAPSGPLRHVLFPCDGSEPSRQALEQVVELSRALEARVTLLHVMQEEPVDVDLDALGAELSRRGAPATVALRCGDAALEILNAIIDLHADVLVMPTHGRSGVARWVFGSVTEKVLRGTKLPLLVVRSGP
jgi:nucleotide-binding universal stress UspA family protein